MIRNRFCHLLFTLTLASGVALVGCSKDEKKAPTTKVASIKKKPEAQPKVPLTFKLNGKDKKKLGAVRKTFSPKSGHFARAAVTKEHAKLFTYIAATSDKPEILDAALVAMATVYGEGAGRVKVDTNYDAVVAHHLKSTNPRVLSRALRAAGEAMHTPEKAPHTLTELTAVLSRLQDGSGRQATLYAFRHLPAEKFDATLLELIEASLDSKDTAVQATALQTLTYAAPSISDSSKLLEQVLPLAKDNEAGVRGQAVELLGAIGLGNADAFKAVLSALEDKSPFVRGLACVALGSLQQRQAIHALVPLTEDTESVRYSITGWQTLRGEKGEVKHRPLPSKTVSGLAIAAVQNLSALGTSENKLSLAGTDEKANAEAVKAWYATEKKALPAAGSPLAKVTLPKPATAAAPSAAVQTASGLTKAPAGSAAQKPAGATPTPATPAAAQPAAPKPAAQPPAAQQPAGATPASK